VSVLYPNGKDIKFDMEYYCNRQVPMVRQLLGSPLKGVAVEQGLTGEQPRSPAPYVAMGHLLFESVDAFRTSFGSTGKQSSQTYLNTRTPNQQFRSAK
jgi:uncharacterized protein (TIGR02118 family)